MRIAFVGAGELSVDTARILLERGHEVVIIETDREKIEELNDDMDCAFLQGDGSRPDILEEVDPGHTDYLFCLSDNDQYNIISALVGRSLGFDKVVVHILNPAFDNICRELGLNNRINSSRTISRYLADMVGGVDILELTTIIKGEARFFNFIVDKKTRGGVSKLDLPENARVICYYRDGKFMLADESTELKEDDEVVILTHSEHLSELTKRFQAKNAEDEEKNEEEENKEKNRR